MTVIMANNRRPSKKGENRKKVRRKADERETNMRDYIYKRLINLQVAHFIFFDSLTSRRQPAATYIAVLFLLKFLYYVLVMVMHSPLNFLVKSLNCSKSLFCVQTHTRLVVRCIYKAAEERKKKKKKRSDRSTRLCSFSFHGSTKKRRNLVSKTDYKVHAQKSKMKTRNLFFLFVLFVSSETK